MTQPIGVKPITNALSLFITEIHDGAVTTMYSDGSHKSKTMLRMNERGHYFFRKQREIHYLNEFIRVPYPVSADEKTNNVSA